LSSESAVGQSYEKKKITSSVLEGSEPTQKKKGNIRKPSEGKKKKEP